MRIIRRYSNRKLYDTHESHYVTLQALAALVRSGEDFQVVDHSSARDLTAATLAQIIFEEEKRGSKLPATELRRIIQSGAIEPTPTSGTR
jgi:polyhydroxyalkanoate synthesis repressor PhaR